MYNFVKKTFRSKTAKHKNLGNWELGRTSLTIGRVINVIKYWLKVVQLDTNYVKIVYNVMCRDLAIKQNSKSWTKSV